MKTLFLSLIAMAAFSAPIAVANTGLGQSGAAAVAPSGSEVRPASTVRRVEPLPPSPEMLGETNAQPQHVAATQASRSHIKIFCGFMHGGEYAELENSMNRWFSEHPKIRITERQRSSIGDGWLAIIIYYEEAAG